MTDDAATWKAGVDIGGTFTDIVLWNVAGEEMYLDKVLTTPDDPSRAVLNSVGRVLKTAGVSASQLISVIHGTTLVANALIERKGMVTGLITTKGFRDVLEIGREWRYDLFNLDLEMPRPLVPRPLRLEVTERIGADGSVLVPFDPAEIDGLIPVLRDAGVESLAICLLHSYRNADHERAVAERIEGELPGVALSLSSDVSPELGEYERTSTTTANAYVHPIFRDYVERLVSSLGELGYSRDLLLVLSDGRCVRAGVAMRYPIRLVQSGPAAGVEAARMFGKLAGVGDALCFDMGGTTAKACLIPGGEPERTTHFEVARETRFAEGSGLPLQIPAIDMIEIGAGGGSIARIDQRGLLQVGPDSAGADPGPVCYGRGNEFPTVTDCDLVLGYLDAASFLGGRMPLDKPAAEQAITKQLAAPLGISMIEAAWGVHETVTANMAQAATIHAIERALDVTRFTMLAIGGAGPVHACSMARKMNIGSLVCPTGAGVASAIGMLASAISFEIARAAPSHLHGLDFKQVLSLVHEMDEEASDLVAGASVPASQISRRLSAMMRYIGQGYEIETPVSNAVIEAGDEAALLSAFTLAYGQRYGRSEDMPAEILSWRMVVEGPRPALDAAMGGQKRAAGSASGPHSTRLVWFDDGFVETPVYARSGLAPGDNLNGPVIVEETESTTVVPVDFSLRIDAALNLILQRHTP